MSMAIRVATLTTPDGNSLVFSNIEDSMDDHQAWLTDLSGFYGGVGVSDPGSQRKLGHGFFAVPSLRTGRALTLSGTITFKTEQLRSTADRFLSGQLWDGDFGTLTVQTDEQVLSCKVKLDGEIKHAYHGVSALQVQIPLTAPDPFLYADSRLYQIYPAGAGEGLVYPLFSTKMTGSPDPATVRGLPEVFGTGVTEDSASNPAPDGGKVAKITATTSSLFFGSWSGTAIPTTLRNQMCRLRIWVFSTTGESVKIRVRHNNTGSAQGINQLITATAKAGVWSPTDTWIMPTSTTTSITFTAVDLTATADNPIWVGGALATGGSISPVLDWGAGAPMGGAFANQGNATAYPEITVRGDFPAGFSIIESGRTLTYSSPVHAASPVTIDNREGAVYVDGIDQTYRLTQRDWFEVKAGSAIQPRIIALAPSNGWADITISDTYI